jgi:hypothetical protein
MRIQKILDKNTGELLVSMIENEDVVNIEPIKYYHDFFIANKLVISGVPSNELKGSKKPSKRSMDVYVSSLKLWNELEKKILKTSIPSNLILLLNSNRKREQENLLKGIEITPMILVALIFRACSEYGFKFSQYRKEIYPNGIDKTKMPYAAEIKDDGDVKIFGKTELSKGFIKQAIEHRTVNIGKFIEKADNWHCFFANYKSLNGDEIWQGKHQPHFHYISNYFGLTKEKVISELKSKNYGLGNLPHLKLIGYWDNKKASH